MVVARTMASVLDRIFSRWNGTGRWGFPLAALLAVFVLLALLWLRPDPAPRAAAQETTSPASPAPSAASPSAASPVAGLEDFEGFFGDASASPLAEEEPEGLPEVGAIDIVGNLKHAFADGTFPCEGPSPDYGVVLWSCVHPSGRYAVEVVADDPLTVYSVTATAYGVPEEDAERFFVHVLGSSLDNAAALDSEAFVSGAVPSGGTAFAGDAGVEVYGSGEARALEITSADAALD